MSISPDSLTDSGFTVGGRSTGSVTFLPEPEREAAVAELDAAA